MSAPAVRIGRICLPLLAVAVLLAPAQSLAAANPIASGRSELRLARHLLGQLAGARGKVGPKGEAVAISSSNFVFRVAGGALDPTDGAGSFTLADGIAIRRGKRAAAIRGITVETSAGLIVAKVGGRKTRLGRFKAVTSRREGFGVSVAIGAIDLTGRAARRLNEALDLEGRARLHGGESLGSLRTTTQPSAVELLPESGIGSYDFGEGDSAFDKLSAREVFFGAIKPIFLFHVSYRFNKPMPTGYDFVLRSVAGWIAPDGSSGALELEGGITLESPLHSSSRVLRLGPMMVNIAGGSVEAELSREPEPLSAGGRVPIFSAPALKVMSVDPITRTFVIQVPEVALTERFAASLNGTFQPPPPPPSAGSILAAGDRLGGMWITAVAR